MYYFFNNIKKILSISYLQNLPKKNMIRRDENIFIHIYFKDLFPPILPDTHPLIAKMTSRGSIVGRPLLVTRFYECGL